MEHLAWRWLRFSRLNPTLMPYGFYRRNNRFSIVIEVVAKGEITPTEKHQKYNFSSEL